eukprot:scaffold338664_cov35-Prasinocladus_malaysianus.AAC.1
MAEGEMSCSGKCMNTSRVIYLVEVPWLTGAENFQDGLLLAIRLCAPEAITLYAERCARTRRAGRFFSCFAFNWWTHRCQRGLKACKVLSNIC